MFGFISIGELAAPVLGGVIYKSAGYAGKSLRFLICLKKCYLNYMLCFCTGWDCCWLSIFDDPKISLNLSPLQE